MSRKEDLNRELTEGGQEVSLDGDAQGTGMGTAGDEEGISRQLGKGALGWLLFPSTLGTWAWLYFVALVLDFLISSMRTRLSFTRGSTGHRFGAQAGKSCGPQSEVYCMTHQLGGLGLVSKHGRGRVSQAVNRKLHLYLPTAVVVGISVLAKGLG